MTDDLKQALMHLSEGMLAQRDCFETLVTAMEEGAVRDAVTAIGVSVERARLQLLMLIETGPVNGASVH